MFTHVYMSTRETRSTLLSVDAMYECDVRIASNGEHGAAHSAICCVWKMSALSAAIGDADHTL